MRELVKAARARGDELTGPDGLLKAITKQVLEAALEEEMTEHVGYDKHAVEGRNGANSRNGTRAKTVLTDNAGPVDDRGAAGPGRQLRAGHRQEAAAAPDATWTRSCCRCTRAGLTTGEISAHFAEIYGASVSARTPSRGSPTR